MAGFVVGPDGEPLRLADLPDATIGRWVPRAKARVVAAVRGGLISEDAAFQRYNLTAEEFGAWARAISELGMRGLRVREMRRARDRVEAAVPPFRCPPADAGGLTSGRAAIATGTAPAGRRSVLSRGADGLQNGVNR